MELKLTREDFINQYPPSNSLNKKDLQTLWNKKGFNLYVHIPYCYKKCEFCYYKSLELGDASVPDEYIQALLREIEMVSSIPQIQSKTVSSVYFGGGTPTKMTCKQMEMVLDKIQASFDMADNFELCFESRPGPETSEDKLRLLREYGIKRLSLGVQSLDDQVLSDNGRSHDTKAFYEKFEMAKRAGIPVINVDIMSGMVNQSMESWMDTIEKLIALKPEGIAVYKLELYLNNALYKKLRERRLTLISDDEEALYAEWGYERLMSAGYLPETNFTFVANEECRHVHRKKLWEGEDMLGIGASAHSCYNQYLFQNEISVEKYMERVKQGELPTMRAYYVSKREEMIRRLIFGIKSTRFEMQRFYNEFGVDVIQLFGKELAYLSEERFIIITDTHIKLTLKGLVYADDIVRLFYLPHQKEVYLSHASRGKQGEHS
ncbi:MAG: coproporphyrinogen III oxidase family protein [Clostridium sp.]|nr:coproporphyrinogen III oxidase family protein [Clostridium sp.]MCM1398262.1 coproporphyrinogen III oxidase family protein [Clostridium sp.]MCM1459074.1 coproporphyrinogen III oxidase family protein [Bacteroides sp.]